MRKITVLLLGFIVISVGLFSGCTEDKVPTNQEILDKKNIIGVWAECYLVDNQSGVNNQLCGV